MELTNIANTKGSNINYDDQGTIINITDKILDTASASMYEVIVKIWDNYDLDQNGAISMDEAKLFVDDFITMQAVKQDKYLILKAFESIDQNGDGKVDMQEMLIFFKVIMSDNMQVFEQPEKFEELIEKIKEGGIANRNDFEE